MPFLGGGSRKGKAPVRPVLLASTSTSSTTTGSGSGPAASVSRVETVSVQIESAVSELEAWEKEQRALRDCLQRLRQGVPQPSNPVETHRELVVNYAPRDRYRRLSVPLDSKVGELKRLAIAAFDVKEPARVAVRAKQARKSADGMGQGKIATPPSSLSNSSHSSLRQVKSHDEPRSPLLPAFTISTAPGRLRSSGRPSTAPIGVRDGPGGFSFSQTRTAGGSDLPPMTPTVSRAETEQQLRRAWSADGGEQQGAGHGQTRRRATVGGGGEWETERENAALEKQWRLMDVVLQCFVDDGAKVGDVLPQYGLLSLQPAHLWISRPLATFHEPYLRFTQVHTFKTSPTSMQVAKHLLHVSGPADVGSWKEAVLEVAEGRVVMGGMSKKDPRVIFDLPLASIEIHHSLISLRDVPSPSPSSSSSRFTTLTSTDGRAKLLHFQDEESLKDLMRVLGPKGWDGEPIAEEDEEAWRIGVVRTAHASTLGMLEVASGARKLTARLRAEAKRKVQRYPSTPEMKPSSSATGGSNFGSPLSIITLPPTGSPSTKLSRSSSDGSSYLSSARRSTRASRGVGSAGPTTLEPPSHPPEVSSVPEAQEEEEQWVRSPVDGLECSSEEEEEEEELFTPPMSPPSGQFMEQQQAPAAGVGNEDRTPIKNDGRYTA